MEAKISQGSDIQSFLKSRFFLPVPSNPSVPHRFCLESWRNNRGFLKKHFRQLAQIWKDKLQGRYIEQQCSSNHIVIHFVKRGETLTSISRQYGVSIQSIAAANAKIVDVDLVLEGQCLNIPSSSRVDVTKMEATWNSWLYSTARDRCKNIMNRHATPKILTMTSSRQLLLAETTGYFLVLVPLIAFCIRCITTVFHHRLVGDLKHQDLNKSEAHHNRSRSIRWKSALHELREPELMDSAARQDSDNNPPEDQPPVSFEEMSNAYTKLEPAYQKFLSECGMSKWGYWRGGSRE